MSVSGKGGGMAAVCHGIPERWGELVSFHSDDVSHVLYSSKPSTLLLFLCASITVWTVANRGMEGRGLVTLFLPRSLPFFINGL